MAGSSKGKVPDFNGEWLDWSEAVTNPLPPNTVLTGSGARSTNAATCFCVGRGIVDGDLVPGMVVFERNPKPNNYCCIVSWNNKIMYLKSFQILVESKSAKYEWISSSNGAAVVNAVIGGKAFSTGQALYIGRILLEGGKLSAAGAVDASKGGLILVNEESEEVQSNYHILVKSKLSSANSKSSSSK